MMNQCQLRLVKRQFSQELGEVLLYLYIPSLHFNLSMILAHACSVIFLLLCVFN